MTQDNNPNGAADLSPSRRFTKKPVTIEAVQWTGHNLREVITFTDGPPDTSTTHAFMDTEVRNCSAEHPEGFDYPVLKINTLEGKMLVRPGDWIIRGIKGEFYPCKPDIFEATYSPALVAAQETKL